MSKREATSLFESGFSGTKVGRIFLGHPTNLEAKAEGEKSLLEKHDASKDAQDVVMQDPRHRARAKLPETKSSRGAYLTHR